MTEITVSNATELRAALTGARGGETILLEAGDYGDLAIRTAHAAHVTLQAISPQTADFGRITLNGAGKVHLDGVEAAYLEVRDSSNIVVTESKFRSGAYFADVETLLLDGNDISGGYHALILNDVQDFEILNNLIHEAQSDLLRITGDSSGGLVENNSLRDTAGIRYPDGTYDHADLLQMMSANGKTPHDIVIRGNHLYDDPTTGVIPAQGIFISDPASGGYRDIVIEQNLINVASPNSIYINGGTDGVIVRHNTLLPSRQDSGAIIRLAEKSGQGNAGTSVYENVIKEIVNETPGATVTGNFIYGRNADIGALFEGGGAAWTDFLPSPGSPADFGSPYGAQIRLRDLVLEATDNATTYQTMRGTADDDVIRALVQNVRLNAMQGDDVLHGSSDNDILRGAAHDDILRGGAGNDILCGGSGNDILTGGDGFDRFRFKQFGERHADVVTDFTSGQDSILLDGRVFDLAPGRIEAGRFHLGWEAMDADHRIIYDASGRLWYDADGSGAGDAELIARFRDAPSITSFDIEIV